MDGIERWANRERFWERYAALTDTGYSDGGPGVRKHGWRERRARRNARRLRREHRAGRIVS